MKWTLEHWEFLLSLLIAVLAVVASLIAFLRRLDTKFATSNALMAEAAKAQAVSSAQIRAETKDGYHKVELRLHGVETVVGPYANEIAELKRNHNDTNIKLAGMDSETQSLRRDLDAVTRRVDVIQNKGTR